MEHLTEKHISEITTLIRAKGVEMEELLYDLVDHVCCMVEDKMEQGKNYASALDESMTSFGNKGIRQIQEETTFLLTKNLLVMKKTMHIIGIAATLMVLVGSVFKVLHLPGAGIMYLSGGCLLGYLFLPLLAIVKVKQKLGKLRTWATVIGIASGFILLHGILFKVMYWPYASLLLRIGSGLLLFGFLPLAVYSAIKNKVVRSSILVTIVLTIGGFSIIFSLVNLGNSKAVSDAILNIQYNINNELIDVQKSNDLLLSQVKDSIRTNDLKELSQLTKQIDELISKMSLDIARSNHPKKSDDELIFILANDMKKISNDLGDLRVLRKEDGLSKVLELIERYQNNFQKVTGNQCSITLNEPNIDYYLSSRKPLFPLGIVIHDLSLLNLQIQRSQTSLLQHYLSSQD